MTSGDVPVPEEPATRWLLVLHAAGDDVTSLFESTPRLRVVTAPLADPAEGITANEHGRTLAAIVVIARSEQQVRAMLDSVAIRGLDRAPIVSHVATGDPLDLGRARRALLDDPVVAALVGQKRQHTGEVAVTTAPPPLPSPAPGTDAVPAPVAPTSATPIPSPRHAAPGMAASPLPSHTSETNDSNRRSLPLVSGRVLYTAPDSMRTGEVDQVEVRVARGDIADELLRQGLRGRNREQIESIPTSTSMTVEVTSSSPAALQVTALSPPTQVVDEELLATWEFDIRAERAGRHALRLSLRCEIDVGDERLVHAPPVIERHVDVDVAPGHAIGSWWRAHWKWAVATAITVSGAVAGWWALLAR